MQKLNIGSLLAAVALVASGPIAAETPFPAITALYPVSAPAGGAPFMLTVTGTGFVPGSSITWNGRRLSTVFVDSTHLTVTVPANLTQGAGIVQTAVVNPGLPLLTSNPVSLPVVDSTTAPTYQISPQSLNFSYNQGGSPPGSQTLSLTSSSSGQSFSATATTDTGWLFVSPSSGTYNATLTVSVSPSLSAGNYHGNITISPGGTVPVTLNVTSATTTPLAISPQQLFFAVPQGSNGTSVLQVTGGSPGQIVPVTFDSTWLQVNPNSGTPPFVITVVANATGLAPNTYHGNVNVGGTNVPVTLAVSPSQPQAAGIQFISGNNQTSPVNQAFPSSLTVEAVDASGNPVSGAAVSWSVTAGSATLSTTSTTTNSSGMASVQAFAGSTVGPISVRAGTGSASVTFSLIATAPASAATLLTAQSSLSVTINQSYLSSPTESIAIVAAGGDVFWTATTSAPWLLVSPGSGSLSENGIGQIEVVFDLTRVTLGINQASITVQSNSTGGPITIPVTLSVLPASSPAAQVNPSGLAFVAPNLAPQQVVFVPDDLNAKLNISTNQPWLTALDASPAPELGGFHTITINVSEAELPVGANYGTVSIQESTTGTYFTISVLAYSPTGTALPSLTASAQGILLTSAGNQFALSVGSTGTGLPFTAEATTQSGGNWLSVTPSQGSTPAGLIVTQSGSLAAGAYSGSVIITSPGAANSPLVVPVTFLSSTSYGSSPSSLTFSYMQGGSPPSAQSVSLTVQNPPAGGITFTASSDSSWLSVSPMSGTYPGTVSIGVLPSSLVAGAYQGNISVYPSGTSFGLQIPVSLTVTAPSTTPTISTATIVNAESGIAGLTPCGLTTISGSNLAPGVTGTIQSTGFGPPPTSLGPVQSIMIGGTATPVLSVSNVNGVQQIGIQTPCEVPVGTTTVTVTLQNGSATVTGVQVFAYQPGIFQVQASDGNLYALATRADGSYIGPANAPVAGETIRVFVTGLGQTNPPIATGVAGASGQLVAAQIIGGVNNAGVPVIDAGYAIGQIGTYYVDMQIPVTSQAGSYQPIAVAVEPPDGSVLVFGNGAFIPIQAAPVSLPSITASPTQVGCTALAGGSAVGSQQVSLGSSGAALGFTIATSGGSWLQATSSSTSTPATISVSCDPTGLAAGAYPGTITVTSNASNNPLTINVNFTVLQVTPQQLSLMATAQGSNAVGSLEVDGPSQTVAITTDQSWLVVNPNQGTPSFGVNVTGVPTGLSAGTYNGNVILNGSANVPVSFTVSTPPPPSGATLIVGNVLSAGMLFQLFVGQPLPTAQTINVNSSDGSTVAFTAKVNYPAGTPSWVYLSSRIGQTPGTLNVGVEVTALGQPGSLTAQLVLSAAGAPDVTIPLTLSYQQPPPSQIQVTLQDLSFFSAGDIQTASIMVTNPGPNVLPFSTIVQTDDGNPWLSVTPTGASTINQQPAMLAVAADPTGLPPGTYTGKIQIQASNQAPLPVAVVFAVGATTTLYSADTALNYSIGSNYLSFLPQELELIAAGSGPVSWQAQTSPGWLSLNPPAGQISPGTIATPQIGVDLSQLSVGNNNGLITITSNSSGGTLSIPVVVQVLPTGYPVVTIQPTGMAFVAPNFSAQPAIFHASTNGTIIPPSPNVPWLKAVEAPSSTIDPLNHQINVSIDQSQLPPGTAVNRGTLTIQDPTGTPRTISVLVYVPATAGPASGTRAAEAVAAVCTPSTFFPLYTSLLPSFEQPGGATSTEIIMIDDCGNLVTSGVAGGVTNNGDPQLQLRSLLDGRWKVTWNPVTPNSFVALNVVGADPVNGINPSAPIQALGGILSAPTAPLLDKMRPFETQAAGRLTALAPNLQFQINGQNFLNPDGTPPQVLIGGEQLQVVSATASQLIVVTPGDVPVNVEMQLVIERLSDGAVSVPQPIIVAPTWPVLAAAATGNSILITGLGRSSSPLAAIEGIRVKSVRRVSSGLWRVELERPLSTAPRSRLRIAHARTETGRTN